MISIHVLSFFVYIHCIELLYDFPSTIIQFIDIHYTNNLLNKNGSLYTTHHTEYVNRIWVCSHVGFEHRIHAVFPVQIQLQSAAHWFKCESAFQCKRCRIFWCRRKRSDMLLFWRRIWYGANPHHNMLQSASKLRTKGADFRRWFSTESALDFLHR